MTTREAIAGLVAALEAIAEYETDWTQGPDENMGQLRYLADRALQVLREREPLRDDPSAYQAVAGNVPHGDCYEKGRCAMTMRVLDAIDTALLGHRSTP